MGDSCLDCGAKISPGWDFCQSCGSVFADQEGRTAEEQRAITKKIRKRQKAKRKESSVGRSVVPKVMIVLGFSGLILMIVGVFLTVEFSLFSVGLTIAIIGVIPFSIAIVYPFRKLPCWGCCP